MPRWPARVAPELQAATGRTKEAPPAAGPAPFPRAPWLNVLPATALRRPALHVPWWPPGQKCCSPGQIAALRSRPLEGEELFHRLTQSLAECAVQEHMNQVPLVIRSALVIVNECRRGCDGIGRFRQSFFDKAASSGEQLFRFARPCGERTYATDGHACLGKRLATIRRLQP